MNFLLFMLQKIYHMFTFTIVVSIIEMFYELYTNCRMNYTDDDNTCACSKAPIC